MYLSIKKHMLDAFLDTKKFPSVSSYAYGGKILTLGCKLLHQCSKQDAL